MLKKIEIDELYGHPEAMEATTLGGVVHRTHTYSHMTLLGAS
jgi:hypothetical protein